MNVIHVNGITKGTPNSNRLFLLQDGGISLDIEKGGIAFRIISNVYIINEYWNDRDRFPGVHDSGQAKKKEKRLWGEKWYYYGLYGHENIKHNSDIHTRLSGREHDLAKEFLLTQVLDQEVHR